MRQSIKFVVEASVDGQVVLKHEVSAPKNEPRANWHTLRSYAEAGCRSAIAAMERALAKANTEPETTICGDEDCGDPEHYNPSARDVAELS